MRSSEEFSVIRNKQTPEAMLSNNYLGIEECVSSKLAAPINYGVEACGGVCLS
jgi:hypothetical protein